MTQATLHYFSENDASAKKLSRALDIPAHEIIIHEFPDGESLVRVVPTSGTAILFVSLNDPNSKLIQLALAVSALKDAGTKRFVLVAPYLCYMRQDKAFNKGEAVSQKVMATFLSSLFDRVITVDPHLHRINDLQDIYEACEANSYSATGSIADALSSEMPNTDSLIFVGPDQESAQWVGAIAERTGSRFIVGSKVRNGDRDVEITLPDRHFIENSHAVIVDDVISSGATICTCAEALKAAGALVIEVVVVHMLASDTDIKAMTKAGVSKIQSSDSVTHSTNAISLAPLLADALRGEL